MLKIWLVSIELSCLKSRVVVQVLSGLVVYNNDDLEVAYNNSESQEIIIIMTDLNAKVGKEKIPLNVTVGPRGL